MKLDIMTFLILKVITSKSDVVMQTDTKTRFCMFLWLVFLQGHIVQNQGQTLFHNLKK